MLRELFAPALLAVVAPCGVLMSHGSPNNKLKRLDDLDRVQFPKPDDPYLFGVLDSFLNDYGQEPEITHNLLASLSTDGMELRLVVHGHDRDSDGCFVEGDNQICPVIFGAPRENKRYIHLDLGASYEIVSDLREGAEIRRLYG
jgi:hypothetical protein